MDIVNLTKVMVPAFVAFTVGIAITPVITHFLYQYKVWKKNPVSVKSPLLGVKISLQRP